MLAENLGVELPLDEECPQFLRCRGIVPRKRPDLIELLPQRLFVRALHLLGDGGIAVEPTPYPFDRQ